MPITPSAPGRRSILSGAILLAVSAAPLCATNLYQDGATARSKALGGADVVTPNDPYEAVASNPASLSGIEKVTIQGTATAGFVHGEFSNSVNDGVEMDENGVFGGGAIALPIGPLTVGFGFVPDIAVRSDWEFEDAPGGLDGGTTYGRRVHKSEIQVMRFAFAASYAITPKLSVGAAVGLLYNDNRLQAPYTIQNQASLRGAKVLLDLEADGWGWNGQFGATWKPIEALQLGVSYTMQSRIRATGRATSDASTQLENVGLGAADPHATFDAEVTNTLPHIVNLGFVLAATKRLTVVGQVDWVNWQSSFDTLDVRLRDVDNPAYDGLLLGKNLDDDVPLQWRDQWIWRAGLEYAFDEHWTARAGYRYANNQVPSGTLTPLNAAISEHMVALGLGYQTERLAVDVAWQYYLPQEETVRGNLITGPEYDESEIETSIHVLSATLTWRF